MPATAARTERDRRSRACRRDPGVGAFGRPSPGRAVRGAGGTYAGCRVGRRRHRRCVPRIPAHRARSGGCADCPPVRRPALVARFHVKQGRSADPSGRSPVDRRTCRRHAPVIPTRSGWSVRTPSIGRTRARTAERTARRERSGSGAPDTARSTLSTRGQPTADGRGGSIVGFSMRHVSHPHRYSDRHGPTGRTRRIGATVQRARGLRPPRERFGGFGRAGADHPLPDDLHHRRRRVDHPDPAELHDRLAAAEPRHRLGVLGRSPSAADAPSAPAAGRRGTASGRHQAASRSSGATARAVTTSAADGPRPLDRRRPPRPDRGTPGPSGQAEPLAPPRRGTRYAGPAARPG